MIQDELDDFVLACKSKFCKIIFISNLSRDQDIYGGRGGRNSRSLQSQWSGTNIDGGLNRKTEPNDLHWS